MVASNDENNGEHTRDHYKNALRTSVGHAVAAADEAGLSKNEILVQVLEGAKITAMDGIFALVNKAARDGTPVPEIMKKVDNAIGIAVAQGPSDKKGGKPPVRFFDR